MYAQSAEIKPDIWKGDNASVNCVFLSHGPPSYYLPINPKSDWCQGFRYRVNLLVHEIYYSILVEKLSFEGWECMDISITGSYYFNSFKIGDLLKLKGELGSMKFLEWISHDSFKIEIQEIPYLVKILENGALQFKKIESLPTEQ
jgi:hypothetical protein